VNYVVRNAISNFANYIKKCVPGSSVGIATGYGLEDPGIKSRCAARFFAPVHTGRGAHPVSCTMSTVSFPGVEIGRGVTLTPHPLLVPRSKHRAFIDCKKGETYLTIREAG
jgi:hypothetical protein